MHNEKNKEKKRKFFKMKSESTLNVSNGMYFQNFVKKIACKNNTNLSENYKKKIQNCIINLAEAAMFVKILPKIQFWLKIKMQVQMKILPQKFFWSKL